MTDWVNVITAQKVMTSQLLKVAVPLVVCDRNLASISFERTTYIIIDILCRSIDLLCRLNELSLFFKIQYVRNALTAFESWVRIPPELPVDFFPQDSKAPSIPCSIYIGVRENEIYIHFPRCNYYIYLIISGH